MKLSFGIKILTTLILSISVWADAPLETILNGDRVLCAVRYKGGKYIEELVGDVQGIKDNRLIVKAKFPERLKGKNLSILINSCGKVRNIVKEKGGFFEEVFTYIKPESSPEAPIKPVKLKDVPKKKVTKKPLKKSEPTEMSVPIKFSAPVNREFKKLKTREERVVVEPRKTIENKVVEKNDSSNISNIIKFLSK